MVTLPPTAMAPALSARSTLRLADRKASHCLATHEGLHAHVGGHGADRRAAPRDYGVDANRVVVPVGLALGVHR